MIDPASSLASQQAFNDSLVNRVNPAPSPEIPGGLGPVGKATPSESFGNLLGNLVDDVKEKGSIAEAETNRVLLGESDNIHQSMIAVQESSMAFSMLVEVRNNLVQAYQELMRMPV